MKDSGLWIAVAACAVIAIVFAITLIYGPTREDCIDKAYELGIPCVERTVKWDEFECECMSAEHRGAELEFRLDDRW